MAIPGLGDRLSYILKEKKIDQKELAEKIGITSKAVSAYVTGKADPSLARFKDIAEILEVSADYLLGLCDDPQGIIKLVGEDEDDEPLTEDILTIRQAYRHMSSRERRIVMQLVKGLVGEIDDDIDS